jgi:hypothetical protein
MVKTMFQSRLVGAAIVAIPFWLGATAAAAGSVEEASVREGEVRTHPSQGSVAAVPGATAILMTTKRGAFAHLATPKLTPGNAYTLWWIVINEPSACETSPCTPSDVLKRTDITKADVGYGGGLIAGSDAAGRFASYLPVGPLTNPWFGNGFVNPLGAEIHLVINDHGPLLPEMAESMLGSARGGCVDESLPSEFPAAAFADGTPGPNTCRMVQAVIFTQAKATSAAAQ